MSGCLGQLITKERHLQSSESAESVGITNFVQGWKDDGGAGCNNGNDSLRIARCSAVDERARNSNTRDYATAKIPRHKDHQLTSGFFPSHVIAFPIFIFISLSMGDFDFDFEFDLPAFCIFCLLTREKERSGGGEEEK